MRFLSLTLTFALCASTLVNGHHVSPCPTGQVLKNGKCVCSPGPVKPADNTCQTRCPDGSTLTDCKCIPRPCGTNRILVNGVCKLLCPAGQVPNNGECICAPGTEKSTDGTTCQPIPCPPDRMLMNGHCIPRCPDGQFWINDKCVCAPGTEKSTDGTTCQPIPCPPDRMLMNGHCILRCPDGQFWINDKCVCAPGTEKSTDGTTCQPIPCPADRTLINGHCVIPHWPNDTIPIDGKCTSVPPVDTREPCPSGVQAGKCFTFTFENGQRFGYDSNSRFYTASKEDDVHQFGKFKVCTNPDCTPGVDIKPGMKFNIQEIQGLGPANGGQRPRIWLNNAKGGSYITRTPSYSDGAHFVITKWPGGKHCLGGYDAGVGLTYAYESVGATILTANDQSCIPMTLTEVPCDIRAENTNCIGDKKTEASTSSPANCKVGLNASMPIDGSGVSGHS